MLGSNDKESIDKGSAEKPDGYCEKDSPALGADVGSLGNVADGPVFGSDDKEGTD